VHRLTGACRAWIVEVFRFGTAILLTENSGGAMEALSQLSQLGLLVAEGVFRRSGRSGVQRL